ncbi:hypothetical protein PC9H_009615 [Pleurotus ostreatus]|uniref:Nucleoporin Nup159/Nup146 N-terminal domain-containing protein n=2 Tax=Pleurotus TaxID=5320 RepID=A0A8H6ZM60_PLEOS|nr:uncharacterized protein PC9H_009615 [Pleurotus ostreatus]KAF7424308.1 hypothetical protein PC9H_009615 [Pleurotus ostreatus]KAG9224762.1 hypothetical protein CCMSSC00406_0002087 [Pleurotus cornucopiae]
MTELTTITRPVPPASLPTSVPVSNDEINYPHFRLLNRQSRVALSPSPFELDSQPPRQLLAVSNSRGWFAVIIKKEGSFGSVALQTAAVAGADSAFTPSNTIPIESASPCTLTFASNDTRLLLGLASGEILVYDTSHLLTGAQTQAKPIHSFQHAVGSSIGQVAANPSTSDATLGSLVAVVSRNGRVFVLNVQTFASEGGWMGTDEAFQPTAVAWSPKGKQLAIGLKSGDILCFTLGDKSKAQKHIPPTAQLPLTSLNWLSPGHTFETTYGSDDPQHHIVSLDTASSTTSYGVLSYPYPTADRPQLSFTVSLPNWNFDQGDGSKSLVLFGDVCSTDVEVMGHVGSKWDQQSRDDSSIAIPLDKNYDETFLLGLVVDLTSTTPAPSVLASGESADWPPAPILYAYLNDGTIQAWHITQAKPYAGMVVPSPATSDATPSPLNVSNIDNMAPEQVMLTPAPPVTSRTPSIEMDSTSSNAFTSQPSPFAQNAGTSSAFTPPSSGPTSQASSPSPFGQTGFNSAFGQPSAFGQNNAPQSVFGQGSFSQKPAFGGSPPLVGGFSSFANSGASTFGQSAFGGSSVPAITVTKTPSGGSQNDDMQAEATATEPDISFGGLSLDKADAPSSETKPGVNSIFGSTAFSAPTPNTSTEPSTGGFIKPASGFGAFSGLGQATKSETPSGFGAFGSASPKSNPEPTKSETPASIFGSAAKPAAPSFGQPSFGQPAFGQSSFGGASLTTSAFGTTGFGKAPTVATASPPSSGGGFASFAKPTPVTFGQTSLASGPKESVFKGTAINQPTDDQPKPQTAFGFRTSQSSNVFGGGSFNASATSQSVFAKLPETPMKTTSSASSSPDSNGAARSPSAKADDDSPVAKPSAPQSAFSSSPFGTPSSSAFKPASGFGAFGSTTPTSSPFFKTEKTVSAFGSAFSTPAPVSPAVSASESPKFGMSSSLGQKPGVFGSPSTPPSTTPKAPAPAVGAFAAFSKSPNAFSAFAGPQKSFKELLAGSDKGEGSDNAEPTITTAPQVSRKQSTDEPSPSKSPIPPRTQTPSLEDASVSRPASNDGESKSSTGPSDANSLSFTSVSSGTSSFVDVTRQDGEAAKSGDESEEVQDSEDEGSFISEPFSSEEGSNDGHLEEEAEHKEDSQEDVEEGETQEEEEEEESAGEREESEAEEEQEGESDASVDHGLRSPSATPTAEVPAARLSKSPTPTPDTSRGSTTPPESPQKPSDSIPPLPAAPPTPVFALPSPSPSLTAPRPSTKPTRSSPLAKTPPLLGDPEKPQVKVEDAALKPKPASPKGIFGVLPAAKVEAQISAEGEDSKASRPKTPPLLSSFGAPKPVTPSIFGGQPTFSAPSSSSPSAFPSTPSPQSQTPGTPSSFFGLSPAPQNAPSPLGRTPGTPTPFFGIPPAPQQAPSPTPIFSMGSSAAKPAPSLFGGQPKPPTSSLAPPPPKPAPRPQEALENGMQKECVYLFSSLAKELEELGTLAREAIKKRDEFGKPASMVHRTSDLQSPEKWGGLDEVVAYGKLLRTVEADIQQLKVLVAEEQQSLPDLQTSMLKAGTRREEISRLDQAKNDADFSQMLKSRTLGPEHHETQMQLRKAIRDIRDRVTKLEQHLEASKVKLSRSTQGKPAFKAPSLVTAHRTFKNIDIAIQQQAHDIADLSSRLAKLDISSLRSATATNSGSRYSGTRRSFNVTPNVAVTTAAALNAERSTQRLKNRLLSLRSEPLMNTKSLAADKPPVAFSTPGKPAAPPMQSPSMNFDLPSAFPSSPSPSPAGSSSRRGAAFSSKHLKSATLKKTFSSPDHQHSAPPPSDFWGPLPSFFPMKQSSTPIVPIKTASTP